MRVKNHLTVSVRSCVVSFDVFFKFSTLKINIHVDHHFAFRQIFLEFYLTTILELNHHVI